MCFFLMQVMQVFVKANQKQQEVPWNTRWWFFKRVFPIWRNDSNIWLQQDFFKEWQQKNPRLPPEQRELTNLPKACLMKMAMEYPEEKATCLGSWVRLPRVFPETARLFAICWEIHMECRILGKICQKCRKWLGRFFFLKRYCSRNIVWNLFIFATATETNGS